MQDFRMQEYIMENGIATHEKSWPNMGYTFLNEREKVGQTVQFFLYENIITDFKRAEYLNWFSHIRKGISEPQNS